MKTPVSYLSYFMLIALLFLNLTACSSETKSEPSALAIVIGSHANSKAPNLNDAHIEKIIEKTVGGHGYVSAVIADGTPEVSATQKFESNFIISNPWSKYKDAMKGRKQIIGYLSSTKADHEELDTLKALEIANRSVSSNSVSDSKEIIVIDTGLSTTGLMSFYNSNLIFADPDAVAAYLSDIKAIPNFSGVNITWIGLGDVAYPQKELSPKQKDSLRNIWTKVIETGGGNVIFLDTPPGKDINPEEYPKVTAIDLPSELTPNFSSNEMKEPVVFHEDTIAFIGDSSQFVNQTQAKATLEPIARYLSQHPEFNALLVGTTAHGNDREFCLTLSYQRATAVKKLLTSFSVPSNQIHIMGMGYEDPWHVSPDRRNDGTYIKEIATKNRKVVLMNADSPEALVLRNKTQYPMN